MTRDKAIEIEKRKLENQGLFYGEKVNQVAAANIDALIELGLLKVDEPPKPETKREKFSKALPWLNVHPEHIIAMIAFDKVFQDD